MKKKIDKLTIISTILCFAPIILGIIMYDKLPDQMASHWDFDNNVNGTMPKLVAIVLLPVIMAAVNLLLNIITSLDPKRKNINNKGLITVRLFVVVLCWILYPITIFSNLKENKVDINIGLVVNIIIGVLFIILGNYMPKTKQNYTFGIKLPWTLDNEENWNKTHRVAGFTMFLSGILFILNGIFWLSGVVLAIAIVISSGIPIIYSAILYSKQRKNEQ